MAGFSPPAIRRLFDRLRNEGYQNGLLSGIFANTAGYHNARNNFAPRGNYSVLLPDDLLGNGWAGSGLDMTLRAPADMARITQRLIDLTMARDPRVQCLREFFGTVNGRTVTGLDVRDRRWVSSDPTHLWHIHISVYRRFAEDMAAMEGVANAILGTGGAAAPPPQTGDWFAMATRADLEAVVRNELTRYFATGEGNPATGRIVQAVNTVVRGSDFQNNILRNVVNGVHTLWWRSEEVANLLRNSAQQGAASQTATEEDDS
jgi:hypothetical protein